MEYDEVNEQLLKSFNLLCNIVRQKSPDQKMKVSLSRLNTLINKKIPDTLKKNAPDDFFELYTDFKSEYDKFKDFILYDKLIGKNIIAIGGGFSSGKSSFLNALMGKRVLPADIDPSTSVPTYIMKGPKHEVQGINIFDAKVSMQPRDIKKIAHGFGEVDDDDDEKITDAVTLGHILESIFFSTPLHQYDNIAFLDTPGYSKPDSIKYSAKTDEQISRSQLNTANFILWFVQADAGTITEEDIKFIRTLRQDIPKLIIVNKADKKNLTDLKNIMEKIRSSLDFKGVHYTDVLAFTCKPEQIGDEKLETFLAENRKKIQKQIGDWDKKQYESNFARNFKALFMRCKEFYEDEINEESKELTRLNTSITRLLGEDIDTEILEPLQLMVKTSQKNVNELKTVRQQLKELQNEFFTEIKYISDVVGIDMPEPSEIDLIRDNVQDPLDILEEYMRIHKIKTDDNLIDMLQETFEGIEPVITKNIGGSDYDETILSMLKNACDIKPEDIHLTDDMK